MRIKEFLITSSLLFASTITVYSTALAETGLNYCQEHYPKAAYCVPIRDETASTTPIDFTFEGVPGIHQLKPSQETAVIYSSSVSSVHINVANDTTGQIIFNGTAKVKQGISCRAGGCKAWTFN